MELIFPLIILATIVVVGAVAIPALKVKNTMVKKTGKYPKGHYMGLGIAIGIPLGIPIGIALGNIALGPAIGAGIGVALGAAMEKNHEKELRPLTKEEKTVQMKTLLVLGAIGVLVMLALVFTLYLRKSSKAATQTPAVSVSSFEECVRAGNPIMESYPRQCRHGDMTYTEIIDDTPLHVGTPCQTSQDCSLPMHYAVQSSCPYQAQCQNGSCVVACPAWEHDTNPEVSKSYLVSCSQDTDCDCSEWDSSSKYPCRCLDQACASVVAE